MDKSRDALTSVTGEVGAFQLTAGVLLGLCITPHSLTMTANKWLTRPTAFWCARPEAYRHLEPETWLNLSSPLMEDGRTLDRCLTFDVDFEGDILTARPPEDTPVVECQKFEHDNSEFQNTAVQRWDLVCSRARVPRYVQTVFFVGNFVGVLASGPVGDAVGRKLCYCAFLTVWIAAGILGAYTSSLYLWIASRFLSGAMSLGYNNCLHVYLTEITSGKWRSVFVYYFINTGWDLGIVVLGGLAYFCRDMAWLELIIALTNVPFLLAWFLMLESPRWLLSKGRSEEAKRVMRTMCRWNGKHRGQEVDNFVDNFFLSEKQKKGSIRDLFKLPATRRNTVLMCACWLSFSMGYFGLIYNTPAFDWSPFLVFVFPGLISIPLNYVAPWIENSVGRKATLTFSLLGGGALLFLTLAFPAGSLGIIVCAWMGTMTSVLAFRVGYTFTKELYPTTLRATGVGTASSAARVGSMVSPLVPLLSTAHELFPLLVYGASMFAAGLGSVWVWPETRKLRLMYTAEECEREATGENTWLAHFNKMKMKKKATTTKS